QGQTPGERPLEAADRDADCAGRHFLSGGGIPPAVPGQARPKPLPFVTGAPDAGSQSRWAGILLSLLCCGSALADVKETPVRVLIQTKISDIEVEVDAARAPATSANFLKYVESGFYDGGLFHRTVKPDNQPENKVKIEVIQASCNPKKEKDQFP